MRELRPERDIRLSPVGRRPRPSTGDREVWNLWGEGSLNGYAHQRTDLSYYQAVRARQQEAAESKRREAEDKARLKAAWEAKQEEYRLAREEEERQRKQLEALRAAERAARARIEVEEQQRWLAKTQREQSGQTRAQPVFAGRQFTGPAPQPEVSRLLPIPLVIDWGTYRQQIGPLKCPSCGLVATLNRPRVVRQVPVLRYWEAPCSGCTAVHRIFDEPYHRKALEAVRRAAMVET